MTTLIKWYAQVPRYTPVNIAAIKTMIDKMVENSIDKIGLRQDLVEIGDITKAFGSKEFLARYNQVLTDMLKDLPQDYFAGKDFFDPYGNPTMPTTRIDPKKDLDVQLDQMISNLRGLIQVAFKGDHSGIEYIANIKNPYQFLEAFERIMPDIGGGAYLDGLQKHVKGLRTRMGKLKNGIFKEENGKSVLSGLNTNLQNVTGQILWENISLKARAKAIESYFNEIQPGITKAFLNSGGKIVTKGVQRGRILSDRGKQEVADSLVVISFREEGDKEVLAITVADSTKLTQEGMGKQRFSVGATKTQSELFTVDYLLRKVNQQVYWQRRLQPYLGNPSDVGKGADATNWDNTRQGFYLLALYDVLAVRATTSGLHAQTLTVNNKIQMINNIIRNVSDYYQNWSTGKSQGSIRNIKNDIFHMGYAGNGYKWYILQQQHISSGSSDKDESKLAEVYQRYIQSVLDTKISIATNVLF